MAGRDRVVHLLRHLERAVQQLGGFRRSADFLFQMASSSIRYGAGVSREVGMDLQNLRAQNVCLMTDRNLSRLPPVKAILESLVKNGVRFKVYDNVRVEPTDSR
uniref:Hydroxyacid-oxoacid transhydrogenase, mitochondrial n=1 Tax=Kryptolebias marmoratus TaxID=37003 RepID=A0A3Q3B7G6_KRYMA